MPIKYYIYNINNMAKKIKNQKLTSKYAPKQNNNPEKKSAFNQYATKMQVAKQKKIQKIGDTKARMLSKKRQNQVIKMSGSLKKIKKFALLDEENGENRPSSERLTHKGVGFGEMRHFNDMNFAEDEWDDGEMEKMQTDMNFVGFDEQGEKVGNSEEKHKSKADIYKQIIEKSKKFKRQRQEQYEQNFQKAVELDQNYEGIIPHLKFRNQVSKTRDKVEKTDKQYEKLINELKDDQRVVANRVIVNDGKGKQKVSKRRNEQLKKLLKSNSDDEDEDVRGWVREAGQDSSESEDYDSDQDEQNSEDDDQNEEFSQKDESSQEDELDDVQLSSGDEQDEQNEDDEGEQEIRIIEDSSSPEVQNNKKMRKNQKKKRKLNQII